ncbi:MAG: histidine kinase [Spirochaetia bacterium]|jgi:sensor histidine kinase YesM
MKIRSKVSLLTGAVFMSAVLVSLLSIWTMNITSRLRDAIDNGNRLVSTALTLHGLMKDLMFDLFTPQTYLLLKDLLHTEQFQSTRQDFRASVQQFETSVDAFMQSPEVKGLLRDQELRDAYETAGIMTAKASLKIASFQSTVDRLFASGVTEGPDLYRQLQSGPETEVSPFFDEVRETSYYLTNSFESFLSHFIRSLQQESALVRRQILFIFWSLTAVIGIATLSFSLGFARRISRRIASVEEGVRAVAHGDFGARLAIRTSDEFGALAEHFNILMTELKKNVDVIQSLMRDVGESLTARPEFQRILELIVEAAVRDSNADGAAVLVMDPVDGLVVASSAGDFPLPEHSPVLEGSDANPPDGIRLQQIVEQGQPVFIRQPRSLGPGREVRSFLAFPLTTTQGTVGTLCVVTVPPQPALADLDFTTFNSFAGYAALIIDNFFKYRELLEKREAEYRALQAQIQPHFLYNVLNGLVGLNRMGDARSLERALFSLKDMLRYILDKGRWTTVGEELDFVARYCELQQLRFAERLTVSISRDETVSSVRIPKLLLQPVVENAVIHGIEPLDRPGRLTVEACMGGQDGARTARITVTDDGAGFPPGAEGAAERIGLANVQERLRMAYPDSRFFIESSPGAGTRICMEIPRTQGNDENPDRG